MTTHSRAVATARAIGVGASAGGLDALIRMVRGIPADIEAPVLIVLHLAPSGRSLLPEILSRHADLPVRAAQDGEPLIPGMIVVAPVDRHLLVVDGRVRLERGPKENGSRPAVDPMFRSLALEYGPGSVAVVLSGALGDGASGAKAVAAAGGQVLVQDPDDATVPSMPESTLAAVGDAAEIVSADLLGSRLAALVHGAPEEEDLLVPAFDDPRELPDDRPDGPPTGLTCPECGGPLWEVEERRYRCRVGHAYSELAFVSAQADSVEAALYVALETLEERAELLRRIARRPGTMRPVNRDNMEAAARDALSRADLIRTALATTGRGADTFDIDSEPAA